MLDGCTIHSFLVVIIHLLLFPHFLCSGFLTSIHSSVVGGVDTWILFLVGYSIVIVSLIKGLYIGLKRHTLCRFRFFSVLYIWMYSRMVIMYVILGCICGLRQYQQKNLNHICFGEQAIWCGWHVCKDSLLYYFCLLEVKMMMAVLNYFAYMAFWNLNLIINLCWDYLIDIAI